MKTKVVLIFAIACPTISIMSMFNPDPNAAMRQRWAEMDRQVQQQMAQDRERAINTASVRNYQASGQLIPPQLMAKLDAGNYAIACQHNQYLLQQQQK